MPYGRKRALEIATTLALDPEMMLLDEPMAGMGHEDIDRIAELIKRVSANRTILMVEHNLSVVASLSDIITVLTRGQVLAEGNYADLTKDERVKEAYLEPVMADGNDRVGRCRCRKAGRRACSRLTISKRGTANPTSFTASVSTSRRERSSRCSAATAPARPRRCKSIMGIVGKRTGSIRVRRHGARRPSRTTHRAVAASRSVPEERGIFATLDGRENLILPPQIAQGGGMIAGPDLHAVSQSQGTAGQSGHQASGGEQQMLAIARILRTGARFLMLDEPTEGLAPVIIQQIGRTIARLKSEGFTILLVEQNFRFASTLADRFYVVEHGRIIDGFANSELQANMDKLHAYLGV